MQKFFSYFFPKQSNHPRYFRCLEVLAVLIFFVYLGLTVTTLTKLPTVDSLAVFAGLMSGICLLGYVAADFMSGFVHFLGDSFGSPTTPFFGPNFILPFRDHHIDQKGITRHDFIDVNGNNCLLSLCMLIPVYHVIDPSQSAWQYALVLFIVTFLFFIFLTNQIHKWAHQDDCPRLVNWLQEKRIILSPSHHRVHHTPPYDKYFCITSGWLNPLLTKVKFFDFVKTLIDSR